jgi:hypothetical protein
MYQLIERWGKVGVGVWLCMSCCEASCYRYKTVRIVVGSNQPHFRMVSTRKTSSWYLFDYNLHFLDLKFFAWRGFLCRTPEIIFWCRIFGRYWNWDKNLKSFPPCYSQSPLLTDFTPCPPPHPWEKLKLVCNVTIIYGILKSEVSRLWPETSSLRTLKIMPRNLNEIVCSWIRRPVSTEYVSSCRVELRFGWKENVYVPSM